MIAPYVTTVLNAFRHQRFNTQPPCIKILIAICAQRLSASEIQHETPMLRSVTRHRAQRLSASEIQHLSCDCGQRRRSLVLNAFRHQRFNTHSRFVQILHKIVLNAFRHQRFNTKFKINKYVLFWRCSTPFGIRDSTPPSHFPKLSQADVLNAFRHQRFNTLDSIVLPCYIQQCSTPFGIRDSTHVFALNFVPVSRSVLNAFRHQRFNTILIKRSPMLLKSAQRLSASEIQHMPQVTSGNIDADVLNAFRHQRFNTKTMRSLACQQQVLNAFRHQRFNTCKRQKRLQQANQCSTPFGIRDSTRIQQSKACMRSLVLNAFRHQRFNTQQYRQLNPKAFVLNAFRHQRFNTSDPSIYLADFLCAQRLSASEIQHVQAQSQPHLMHIVLNAFRHQRFNTLP